MPIRGPHVFSELQQAQDRVQKNVRDLENSAREFDSKMGQLVSQRGEQFLELAQHYLPNLTLETVEKSFDDVRNELLDLFHRKKTREQELDKSIKQAQQTIVTAQAETDSVTLELNEKVKQRDAMQEEVAERLKKIPEYEQLTNEAARAEQRLTNNEERMNQVQEEAKLKLPSYDNSRLFRYLYDRQFGTPDYRSRGLARRIDRWLARYIGYAQARRSYEFMKVTPELMAAELQRRREQFNSLMELVEAMESQVEQEVGLTDVVAEGDRLGEQRDQLINQIDDQNRNLEQFQAELNELRESSGKYYDDALTKMRGHLEATEEIVLKKRASETAEPHDDKIVADIVELNLLIGNLQPEILLLVGQRRSMTEKQAGLDEIVRRFRSSNFDSNRSVFSSHLQIGKSVDQFLNNELDTRALWKHLRQSQKFEESWAQQKSTDILNDPSAQIVMHTMLDLAREALKGSARRSVYRRNSSGSGGISWPSLPPGGSGKRRSSRRRPSSRQSSSRRRSTPRRSRGGFTTGEGF